MRLQCPLEGALRQSGDRTGDRSAGGIEKREKLTQYMFSVTK